MVDILDAITSMPLNVEDLAPIASPESEDIFDIAQTSKVVLIEEVKAGNFASSYLYPMLMSLYPELVDEPNESYTKAMQNDPGIQYLYRFKRMLQTSEDPNLDPEAFKIFSKHTADRIVVFPDERGDLSTVLEAYKRKYIEVINTTIEEIEHNFARKTDIPYNHYVLSLLQSGRIFFGEDFPPELASKLYKNIDLEKIMTQFDISLNQDPTKLMEMLEFLALYKASDPEKRDIRDYLKPKHLKLINDYLDDTTYGDTFLLKTAYYLSIIDAEDVSVSDRGVVIKPRVKVPQAAPTQPLPERWRH